VTTATSPLGKEQQLALAVFDSALTPIPDTERLQRGEQASAALGGLGFALAALSLCAALALLIAAGLFSTPPGSLS
jgi:hypothetical protein